MGKWKQKAIYQDYPVKRVLLKCESGLAPISGTLEIDLKDMGEVKVHPFQAMWRPVNGHEDDGPVGIESWKRIRRQTVTQLPPPETPKGHGINAFGDLKLESWKIDKDGQSTSLGEIIWRDVYVDTRGFEDLNIGLAKARLHSEGSVIIPITGIERFWDEFGPLLCAINRRLPSGKWDTRTIENGTTPYSAKDVFRYLFSQLPGSPSIVGNAPDHLATLELTPPVNVIGEGEPVKQHIDRLLTRYNLTAQRQPDGNYAITRTGSVYPEYGKISESLGKLVDVTNVHREQKTTSINQAPPLVMVIGGPRIRRITLPCVPVCEAFDGTVYTLDGFCNKISYSVQEAARQLTLPESKRFKNAPPLPSDVETMRQHERNREALKKCAFKMYAVSSAIPDNANDPILNPDDEAIPFLPMHNFGVYDSELEEIVNRPLMAADNPGKGDLGPFRVIGPQVRSKRVGKASFANELELKRYWDQVKATIESDVEYTKQAIDNLWSQMADPVEYSKIINQINGGLESSYDADAGVQIYGTNWKQTLRDAATPSGTPGKAGTPIKIDAEIARIVGLENYGTISHLIYKEDMTAQVQGALYYAKKIKQTSDLWKSHIASVSTQVAQMNEAYNAAKKAILKGDGIPAWVNLPFGLAPRGSWQVLDARRGLILFDEPQGHMGAPVVLDREQAYRWGGMINDGSVDVTFGYCTGLNNVHDVTTVLMSEGAGSEPAAIVGVCRSSPVKARAVAAPEIQLYEEEWGNPMNVTAVCSAAMDKAAGLLNQIKDSEGYIYTLTGFRKAVLDAGFTAVEYDWAIKGGSRPHTIVAMNAPAGRALGGLPGFKHRRAREYGNAGVTRTTRLLDG